jgi:hypothetical protein
VRNDTGMNRQRLAMMLYARDLLDVALDPRARIEPGHCTSVRRAVRAIPLVGARKAVLRLSRRRPARLRDA